jgi:hypothetical protein
MLTISNFPTFSFELIQGLTAMGIFILTEAGGNFFKNPANISSKRSAESEMMTTNGNR